MTFFMSEGPFCYIKTAWLLQSSDDLYFRWLHDWELLKLMEKFCRIQAFSDKRFATEALRLTSVFYFSKIYFRYWLFSWSHSEKSVKNSLTRWSTRDLSVAYSDLLRYEGKSFLMNRHCIRNEQCWGKSSNLYEHDFKWNAEANFLAHRTAFGKKIMTWINIQYQKSKMLAQKSATYH